MSSSTTTNDPDNGKTKDKQQQQQQQPTLYQQVYTGGGGGMTPSIITTINNTSPTPIIDHTDQARDVANNREVQSKGARTVEPPPYYESYIEDSFVGHWEREDDDPDYDYGGLHRGSGDSQRAEEEDESIHPSTIEFDFDSFGPESFIYTPAAAATAAAKQQTAQQDIPAAETNQQQVTGGDEQPLAEMVSKAPEEQTVAAPVSVTEQKREDLLEEEAKQEEPPKPKERQAAPPIRVCELKPSPVDYLVDPAQIDLKVIEPYKKVISHAGYCHHLDPSAPPPKPGEQPPAIIVFSACYLPDRSRRDYDYVMDHLFLYVLSSLHELIADDYILIYLHNTQPSATSANIHTSLLSSPSSSSSSSSSPATTTISHSANGSTSTATTKTTCSSSSGGHHHHHHHHHHDEHHLHQNNLPTFTWMKRCYQMIDRKLRKNLKILYLVKPTFWLKTIVIMCRPFISGKFSKKLRFIEDMEALRKCLPVDQLILPASADCL